MSIEQRVEQDGVSVDCIPVDENTKSEFPLDIKAIASRRRRRSLTLHIPLSMGFSWHRWLLVLVLLPLYL